MKVQNLPRCLRLRVVSTDEGRAGASRFLLPPSWLLVHYIAPSPGEVNRVSLGLIPAGFLSSLAPMRHPRHWKVYKRARHARTRSKDPTKSSWTFVILEHYPVVPLSWPGPKSHQFATVSDNQWLQTIAFVSNLSLSFLNIRLLLGVSDPQRTFTSLLVDTQDVDPRRKGRNGLRVS